MPPGRIQTAPNRVGPDEQEAVARLAQRLIKGLFPHLATRLTAAARHPDAAAHRAALAFLCDGGDSG